MLRGEESVVGDGGRWDCCVLLEETWSAGLGYVVGLEKEVTVWRG